MEIDELLWAGGDAQAVALRDGRVTAPELTEAVLARIDATQPRLNAFRAVYADSAREEARAAQSRLDAGETTPLLGVPVAVKDDQDAAGDVTPLGGRPQGPPATADAAPIARLRAAGAVVVGRTHVPERMQWPFTETLTFGATRNPWDLDRTPGGSSGGTAAAVAAGVVGVATGSDGGGSIRIPSSICGLFGLKPTRDLVSTAPNDEGWYGLGVAGPLGRTVADAAAMLDVLANDGWASGGAAPAHPQGTYREAADRDPGRLRIALSWRAPVGRVPVQKERRAAIEETAARLRALGHEVVEREVPFGPRAFPQFLVRYLRGIADDVEPLPHKEWLEPRTRGSYRLGRLLPDRALRWALQQEAVLHERLAPYFADVDVVLQPGMTDVPWRIGAFQKRGALTTMLGVSQRMPHMPVWNVLGYPVAAVPIGRDRRDLPMGAQLVGLPGTERRLLSLSGQLERDRPWAQDRPAAFA
ncbi:amidase [Patulibacter americanus]|uniref:amidase n=1 Tax=Patulibacter americanus TaxID=588672 RepID=UPI0003B31507|nr:amidase [Patulibacter americanus]